MPFVLLRVSTLPFETLAPLGTRRAQPALGELFDAERELEAEAAALSQQLHDAAGDGSDPARARVRLALIKLRRDAHNRRPLRETDLARVRGRVPAALVARLEHHEGLRRRVAELTRACRRTCEEELHRSRTALLGCIEHPLVAEGIRLASRALDSRLRALGRREPARWRHAERHVAAKAVAYLARFCTKTSPASLFCASAPVEVGGDRVAVEGHAAIERVDLLLSIAEARKIAACLAVDDRIRAAIVPRPNPTLRQDADGWTFWKPASPRNPTDEEVRSRVRDQPVLRAFIEGAAKGRQDANELIERVAERSGFDLADVQAFYRQLVERGVLIGEVELPYNSRRPLRELGGAVARAGCAPPWLAIVDETERRVDALPRLPPPERAAAERGIIELLEKLPHERPLKPDELFRVDAGSALRLRLPPDLLEELRAPLRAYVRLFSAIYPERIYRSALAARFLQRFSADTEVNLLDVYHGVFEAEERQRPAAFPDPQRVSPDGDGTSDASQILRGARDELARRAREAAPGEEIRLDDEELAAMAGGCPEPRWSCGVLFQIAARDPRAIDEGAYRLVLSSLFQGAGLSLARFAHLHGAGASGDANPIVRELGRCWSAFEREGAIVAELTYNHNARTANAGLRPAILRYEIELPGEKASPGAEAIPMRDLSVSWCSAEARFVLRWARRAVEVVPVITSGVNPVGVISFLVAIGQHGVQPVGYFPGFDDPGVTHWPRCVSGRTVLFRERWVFRPGEWPVLAEPGASAVDGLIELARWRRRHRLPRHVFVHTSTAPKPRYLDLDSPIFFELFQRSVAASAADAELHVTEMLPGPEEMWVRDAAGRFATEFLVQLQGPTHDSGEGNG